METPKDAADLDEVETREWLDALDYVLQSGGPVKVARLLHPGESPRVPYVSQCLKDEPGVFIAASDYVKALPDSIDRWLPRPITVLGTDGFGRSETRAGLREFFEVDCRYVVLATLAALARDGQLAPDVVQQAMTTHEINPEKPNPAVS